MPPRVSHANIITLARLPLLGLVAWLLIEPQAYAAWAALGLLPILFLMDWLDGFYARQRDQVSDLGGVLDIAIDRVVENALWIVFTHLHAVPVWVPLLFIVRSFVVDGLRGYALAKGQSAFGMMHSPLGRLLVAGRFMRGLYGLAKGGAFCALAAGLALQRMDAVPQAWAWLPAGADLLVYLAAALCLVRAIPVCLDIRALLG